MSLSRIGGVLALAGVQSTRIVQQVCHKVKNLIQGGRQHLDTDYLEETYFKYVSYHFLMTFQPVVLNGPSGSGKSTLIKKLMDQYKDCFAFSVSHTTRQARPGEVNGKDYYFVSRDAMKKSIENKEFIEHAEFSGNFYGTSKQAVQDVQQTGRICILDIDMQGVKSVKQTDLDPRYIFIAPPNDEILEERLRGRGTEKEDAIQKRLSRAKAEMDFSKQPGVFDHVIVNDDLDTAYVRLRDILVKDLGHISKAQGH